jgi:hypothetical protein
MHRVEMCIRTRSQPAPRFGVTMMLLDLRSEWTAPALCVCGRDWSHVHRVEIVHSDPKVNQLRGWGSS